MPDKIYDVPAAWAKRAYIDDAKYHAMYGRSIKDPNAFWGEAGKRIHWYRPFTKVKDTSFDPHNVSIKWFEDGTTNAAYNCIDRHLHTRGDQVAIIWEGDDPKELKKDHLSGTARRSLPPRQCAAQPQRRKGRPRYHLPADDSGGGLRHPRLRAHRRHSFRGVRRLLSGIARRPDRGLPVEGRHHRRRRFARRPQGAAEGQHRRGDRQSRRRRSRHRGQAHRRTRQHAARTRRLVQRRRRHGDVGMSVRRDERGGPAIHSLYVGFDRETEGRAAHHRRLSGLRLDDAPGCVRLSRRRHLLVHRRRRLGHRPQLHRLWTRSPTARPR